jgi:hypothetical protein
LLEFVDAAVEPTDLLAALLEVESLLELVLALEAVELELGAELAVVAEPLVLSAPPAAAGVTVLELVPDVLPDEVELGLVVALAGPLVAAEPVPVDTGPPVPVAPRPVVPSAPVPVVPPMPVAVAGDDGLTPSPSRDAAVWFGVGAAPGIVVSTYRRLSGSSVIVSGWLAVVPAAARDDWLGPSPSREAAVWFAGGAVCGAELLACVVLETPATPWAGAVRARAGETFRTIAGA